MDDDEDRGMSGNGNRGLQVNRLGISTKFGESFLVYVRDKEGERERNNQKYVLNYFLIKNTYV